MRTILRLSPAAFVFAAFALTAPAARACMPSEFETPLCAIYWRSEIVFIAKVKSIGRGVSSEANEDGVYTKFKKARLQVEEVLRGEIADEVWSELTGNGGADCRPTYEKGKRYLIYTSYYDAAMGEVGALHYVELEPGDEDYLKTVRAFSKPKTEAQVLGTITSDTLKPLGGVEVLMESEGQRYSTTTDEKGKYSFVLKPGGAFKVSMIFPPDTLEEGYAGVDYLAEEPSRTVLGYGGTLQAGQCHYVEPHVYFPKQK